MSEISLEQFAVCLESRDYPQAVRDLVHALRMRAESVGDDVRIRAHQSPRGSIGLTFKRGRRVFLRADPKPMKGHVCVSIPGASDEALAPAGGVHRRKGIAPSWVDVTALAGVELLHSETLASYERAGD